MIGPLIYSVSESAGFESRLSGNLFWRKYSCRYAVTTFVKAIRLHSYHPKNGIYLSRLFRTASAFSNLKPMHFRMFFTDICVRTRGHFMFLWSFGGKVTERWKKKILAKYYDMIKERQEILRHGGVRCAGKILEGNPKGRRPLGRKLNADVTLVSTRVLNKWTCEYVKWIRRSNGIRKKRPLSCRDERISQYSSYNYIS